MTNQPPKPFSNLELISYTISNDTSWQDHKYGITESIKDLIGKVYPDVDKGKKSTIKRLERLIKQYPGIPQFKNYLSKAWLAAGNSAKATEVNDRLLEIHPEYLFGKINKAHTCIEKGQTEEVPEILGERLELQALYPDRDEFHILEVLSFYTTVIIYYLETDQRDKAVAWVDLMRKLDRHAPQTQLVEEKLEGFDLRKNYEKVREKLANDRDIERTVESRGYRKSTQTDRKPKFHHPEIEALYTHGPDIPGFVINRILKLPRETLIADLEAVLEDAINRHEVLEKQTREKGWDDRIYTFSVHAVVLLAELKSEGSLPAVLDLLRQGDDFMDVWYSDWLEDFFTKPVSVLAENSLNVLDEFIREPGRSWYARNIAVVAAEKVVLRDPGRREQVINLYRSWFDFLLEHEDDNRLYDTKLLCFIIWSCINIRGEELLDTIHDLYERNLVLVSMLGTYEDVESDILYKDPKPVMKPFDIFDFYEHLEKISDVDINDIDPNYLDDSGDSGLSGNYNPPGDFGGAGNPGFSGKSKDPEFSSGSGLSGRMGSGGFSRPRLPDPFSGSATPETNPLKNVGRNDPCPCGSGKKFKKCCMT